MPRWNGFNSLQTGKPIQSDNWRKAWGRKHSSFNSLQTGKPIQRTLTEQIRRVKVSIPFKRESLSKERNLRSRFSGDKLNLVSIPFKRESLSKVEGTPKRKEQQEKFQFPSNGKAYPKLGGTADSYVRNATHRFNSLQTGKPIQS